MATTTPPPVPPWVPGVNARLVGPLNQRFHRDEDGHRWYEIDWHIQTPSQHSLIASVLQSWPLFEVGSPFNVQMAWPERIGVDMWAFCTPTLNIAPHPDVKAGTPCRDWVVTQTWSTKQSWRCQTFPVENPLLEPVQISGDFVHEQRTASRDRFGKVLRHPNFEPITGPSTEYKYSYPTISFSFNVATLPQSTFVGLINKLNDAPLWGLPERTVRFVDAKWTRNVYGNCFYYFNVNYTFEFDIEGFDKEVPAEGTLVYGGSGAFDDPKSFIPYKTVTDENASVPLDYLGRALLFLGYDPVTQEPMYQYPQYIQKPEVHDQGNLLLLGIPSSLN